jgi:hypothetical protein
MRRILILRLWNDSPAYNAMKQLHLAHEDNSVFVAYDPTLETKWTYRPDDRTILLRGTETYIPGILQKTLDGIRICMHLFQFDVLVRSNASTVIDCKELDRLLPNDAPYIYGGTPFAICWVDEAAGITADVLPELYGDVFMSGTGITLCRGMCGVLLHCAPQLKSNLVDDVSIGVLFRTLPVTWNTAFSCGVGRVTNCVFYRFCSDDRMGDAADIATQYTLLGLGH